MQPPQSERETKRADLAVSCAGPTAPDSVSCLSTPEPVSVSSVPEAATEGKRGHGKVFRKVIFQIHLWIGLTVGLYIMLMSITGVLQVFYDEISLLLNPRVQVGSKRLSLSAIEKAAAETSPGSRATWIHLARDIDSPVEVILKNDNSSTKTVVLVNPYTGVVLGQKNGLLLFLRDFHFNLLLGKNGKTLNGIGACFLLALAATGLIAWWTRAGSLLGKVTIDLKANWKRLSFDTHSAVGALALPVIFIWGTSALSFVFADQFKQVVKHVVPDGQSAAAPAPDSVSASPRQSPRISWLALPHGNVDRFIQTAQDDGFAVTWIKLPASPDANNRARLTLVNSSLGGEDAHTFVDIDTTSGLVTAISKPEDRKRIERLMSWLEALHFGHWAGTFSRALWVVIGLAPAVLFVTGASMWCNRVLKRFIQKR